MACIFEIKLGTSDIIAILAFSVSILSARYAYRAWKEAEKANKINLLAHKKEIYDAFFELKMHMEQSALFAKMSEVTKFYRLSKSANIYFPTELAENIEKYYEACFQVAIIHKKNDVHTKDSNSESETHLKIERDLAPKIEKAMLKLLKEAQA